MSEGPIELSPRDIQINRGVTPASLVRLPEQYKKRLGGQEFMPLPDFSFFSELSARYGFSTRQQTEGEAVIEFGRDTFFAAVSDIKRYAQQLREADGISEVPFVVTEDMPRRKRNAVIGRYAEAEKQRPSSKRTADIVYLFLHTPQVRNIYNQINAEKMGLAFPQFANKLSSLDPTMHTDLPSYFDAASEEMKNSMREVVSQRNDPRDEDMGLLTGFEEYEYMRPESLRKDDYATFGIDFLRSVTEKIVTEAISNGEDSRAKLHREFLTRDGLAFRLMRVPLRSVYDARGLLRDIETISVGEARANIDEGELGLGACPAILKMPLPNGGMSERPIAYEYAATMAEHMSLQRAA